MHTDEMVREGSSLGHVPADRWTFDDSVTAVFPDMLRRSIPQYEVMRKAVLNIGSPHLRPGSLLVDLGCSRGDGMVDFVDAFGSQCRYLGVDNSTPMLSVALKRFATAIAAGFLSIIPLDLREGYPSPLANLTLCVLSLQFTPVEHRHRILRNVYEHTAHGGAFILVEKILGSTAALNSRMIEMYYLHKFESGYSQEEIELKRRSLEGVLVPLTSQWNEALLRDAGFQDVDCFWRWMNFSGWIAIRR